MSSILLICLSEGFTGFIDGMGRRVYHCILYGWTGMRLATHLRRVARVAWELTRIFFFAIEDAGLMQESSCFRLLCIQTGEEVS